MVYKIHLQNRNDIINISVGNLNKIASLIKIYSDVENDSFITGLWPFTTMTYPIDFTSDWLIKE